MKLKILIQAVYLFSALILNAQVPQSINYQAVARNVNGSEVANQFITIQITIREPSPTGNIVYQEIDTATTNQFGLFSIYIGTGQVTVGSFSSIDWAIGNKYIQVGFDPNGGSSFTNMGTSKLLSVPYSLYAGNSAIADSIRGVNMSGLFSQTAVSVRYNGILPTDNSINHVILSNYGVSLTGLTNTNYSYLLYRGLNNIQTFSTSGTILATDTTSTNPIIYIAAPPLGCSGLSYQYQGQILGVYTNNTSGVYYCPLSATGISNPPQLYSYSCNTGHWTAWQAQYYSNYRYVPLLPNNNSVTGFNLTFPVTVTISH